jgi:MYXO-CTERM domain-containing protein
MSRVLLLAVFLPGVAAAEDGLYASEVRELFFADRFDAFEALEVDTGSLPVGSPLAVRFYIQSRGGSYAEFFSESHLSWPDPLSQQIVGVPDTGLLDVKCDLELAAQVTFDLWGYRGAYDVWSERLRLQKDTTFDPDLLPDGAPSRVEVTADGDGLIRPWTVDLPLFAGLELKFEVEVFPRVRGSLAGREYETNGKVAARTGEIVLHDVPEQDPGVLPLETSWIGEAGASLSVVVRPSLQICAPFLGCYRVARFDVPVPLVDATVPRVFTAEPYEHPLPALDAPVTTHDFGDVPVESLANLQLPLTNIGRLPLEGWMTIEGDASFSVFPDYFFASAGNTDGAVVTFDPSAPGIKTATLVIESNDPSTPTLRIPLAGNGWEEVDREDPDAPRVSGEVGCGCATTTPSSTGAGALALGLLAAFARRRRSSATATKG